MAGLTGRNIKDSYGDLLHISNNNIGVDSTSRNVEDGGGTATTLHLSTTGMKNTGTTILGSGVEDGSTANYPHVLHGDVLVRADGSANGAVLTIENVQEDADDATDDAVLILHSDDPRLDFLDRNDSSVAADKRLFRLGYQNGVFKFESQYGDGTNAVEVLKLTAAGGPGGSPRSVFGPGNAEGGYAHTFHGDVVIKETDAGSSALLKLDSAGADPDDLSSLILSGTAATILFLDTDGDPGKSRQNISLGSGALNFGVYNDDGSVLYGVPFRIKPGADPATQRNVIMEDLPTTDPSVTGALWNRGGHVAVSGQLPAIYDSGWGTSLQGTALAANTTMAVVIDEDFFNNLVFRNVQVFARDSSNAYSQFIPIPTSYIVEETSGGTQFSVGVKWSAQVVGGVYYINFTTGDYATLETDAPGVYEWVTHLDEIRVTIT